MLKPSASGRPPMVRNLLVIQVPDASDKGMVTILLRPIDCFFLSFEGAEHVVPIGFDHIIVNRRPFRTALGTSFYVNVLHSSFLPSTLSGDTGGANVSFFRAFYRGRMEESWPRVDRIDGWWNGTQKSNSKTSH